MAMLHVNCAMVRATVNAYELLFDVSSARELKMHVNCDSVHNITVYCCRHSCVELGVPNFRQLTSKFRGLLFIHSFQEMILLYRLTPNTR